MKKYFVIGLFVLSYVVEAQIGTTPCASDADCTGHANSICDTVTSGTCVCAAAQGYVLNGDASGCIYNCGHPPTITGGNWAFFNTVTGSTAFYNCVAGFQLNGAYSITCITATGWETAPTCVAGKLKDFCTANTALCTNIDNGECNGKRCSCLAGYEDDGTTYACVEINECLTKPCTNGGTCSDLINQYNCNCSTGYEGPNCQININECSGHACENGATCVDKINDYECTCPAGYNGTFCENAAPLLKCPVNVDPRNTMWDEALPGQMRYKLCPNNATGNVTRMCRSDGTWQLPQYNCVRAVVDNITTQVNDVLENATTESVEDVLKLIADITNQEDVTDVTLLLSDAELTTLSTSLVTVAEALDNIENSTVNVSALANSFVASASNLLQSANKDSWKSLVESNNDGASKVLAAVDTFGSVLTKDVQSGKIDEHVIVKKNIAIEIKKVQGTVRFPGPNTANTQGNDEDWVKNSKSEIRLEQDSFPANSNTTYVTTAVMYRDMSEILPTSTSDNETRDGDTVEINAPILALSVHPKIGKVDPPVTITFEHILKNSTNASCTFWEYETNGRQGFWSDIGCSVNIVLTNDEQTVCECDHLTNFAVLMSPFVEPPSGGHTTALRVVSIIGISISSLCLLVTIVTHLYLWKKVRGTQATLLIHLCVALLLAYVVFLAGVDRTESEGFCAVVAAVLHYIYLVVFGLMLAKGVEIVFVVLVVFGTNDDNRPKKLVITAWVLPAIIVGISIGATKGNGYGNDSFCWLSVDSGLIWAFIAPALTVILSNLICLIIVFRQMFNMKSMESKTTKEKVKTTARSLCVLVPLMGVSWILGIFYINESLYFMQYLFAIVNSLQGVFIFIFHCLLNKKIRTGIKMKKMRRSASRKTFKTSISNSKSVKGHTHSTDCSLAETSVSNGSRNWHDNALYVDQACVSNV